MMDCKKSNTCKEYEAVGEKVRKPEILESYYHEGAFVVGDEKSSFVFMHKDGDWSSGASEDGKIYPTREIAQGYIDHYYPKAAKYEPMERRVGGKVRADSLKIGDKFIHNDGGHDGLTVVGVSDLLRADFCKDHVLAISKTHRIGWSYNRSMVTPIYDGPERRLVTEEAKVKRDPDGAYWYIERNVKGGSGLYLNKSGEWHGIDARIGINNTQEWPTEHEAQQALNAWHKSIGRPAVTK